MRSLSRWLYWEEIYDVLAICEYEGSVVESCQRKVDICGRVVVCESIKMDMSSGYSLL